MTPSATRSRIAGDAYMGWTVRYAKKMLGRLERYDMEWVEEPVIPDDIDGYAAVRASSNVPISGGEHEFTRWGHKELLEREAVDILQPDVHRCGGLTELLKIDSMASAHDVPVVPHSGTNPHLHFIAASTNAPSPSTSRSLTGTNSANRKLKTVTRRTPTRSTPTRRTQRTAMIPLPEGVGLEFRTEPRGDRTLQHRVTMSDISFEYNVPVFAGAPDEGDEPVHRDTPMYEELDWETTKKGVLKAEELGFDAVWAPDHLMLGRDRAEYECWTLLSAIAGMTEDIRMGSLVLCNDYRNPALVAKMAATLDVVSDGRLELGLGAGWHEPEYEAYGWEYRDGFERLMRLDESIRLIKELWADDGTGVSFDGDHYQIEDAYVRSRSRTGPTSTRSSSAAKASR